MYVEKALISGASGLLFRGVRRNGFPELLLCGWRQLQEESPLNGRAISVL